MTKTFNSFATTMPTSEGDLYTASSKSMTLLINTVNPSGANATCSMWITDGSNNHISCLIPLQTIAAGSGLSDNGKHIILAGYKIRGTSDTTGALYVEINVLEGM